MSVLTEETVESLDALLAMLDDIRYEEETLKERKAVVTAKVLALLPDGTFENDRGRATVTRRKTFKTGLAEGIIETRDDIPKKDRDRLFTKVVDRKMLAALYPDIEAAATVESDPYLTFRAAK